LPLLNNDKTAASFHASGKYCWVRFKLNICLRIGIKILEHYFMIKPGISSTTDLEGFSLLMALQTSTTEMGARDKTSNNCERGEKSIEQRLL
jgi:hypothetical protein